MKNSIMILVLMGSLSFGTIGITNAQIFDHADDEETKVLGTEKEVFASEPFEKKGAISKRSDGGATFDSNMKFEGNVPIDGGISIFVVGLLGYGIKKMRKSKMKGDADSFYWL
jgi:hypothetical protein